MALVVNGKPAVFSRCLLDELTDNGHLGDLVDILVAIGIDHQASGLRLSLVHSDGRDVEGISWVHISLGHNFPCPAHVQRFVPIVPSSAPSPVAIAAAVLLENDRGELLLTRRPAHMRSFPLGWVVPGGSVEPGETIIDAGLRELRGLIRVYEQRLIGPSEETGVDLLSSPIAPPQVIALWESTYPTRAEDGPIRRHHLVVYLHMRLSAAFLNSIPPPSAMSSADLDPTMPASPFCFQDAEVDMAVWMSAAQFRVAFLPPPSKATCETAPLPPCPIAVVWTKTQPGRTEETHVNPLHCRGATLSSPHCGEWWIDARSMHGENRSEAGTITEGTRYAVEQWMKNKA